MGAKTGQRDEDEGRPVFTLHYDAYQAFEEANHDVCFVDKYRLIHLEDGAEMTWKREGQEMDRDAVMASLGDEAVDLQEVSSRDCALIARGGVYSQRRLYNVFFVSVPCCVVVPCRCPNNTAVWFDKNG